MALDKVGIRYAPLSNRIVLARFGKDPEVALDTRDGMDEFLKTLVQYAFDGKMPAKGERAAVDFGGGDEQYEIIVRRKTGEIPIVRMFDPEHQL